MLADAATFHRPAPDQVDRFASRLEEVLHISVPQLGKSADSATSLTSLQELRAIKSPDRGVLALDNGDGLQLFRDRPWLGEGAYAKVLVGLFGCRASPTQPARTELVAVKKAKLSVLREQLDQEQGAAALARHTHRKVVEEAVHESSLALRAQSLAAARRLVVTDKQAYMVMPPMTASLHETLREIQRPSPASAVSWSIWGTYVLNEVLPKVREAHANQVVHHDLSLQNILLRGRGLHLSDFGFAQHIGGRHENIFHGTPWCAAPEALCATPMAPSSPVANEFYALGMITLVVASGPHYGQTLYQSLIAHTSEEAGRSMRRAYKAGWPSCYAGDPIPPHALRCRRLFGALSHAFAHTQEPLRSELRLLVHPRPEQRRHGASLASDGLQLSHHDRQAVYDELDAINERAAHRLLERLSGRR